MSQPTLNQVHANRPLTNLTIGWMQNQDHFIAHRVFPNVPVTHRSDDYYVWDRGSFNMDRAKKRAPATRAAFAGVGLSTDTYSVDVWALSDTIPDQIRDNADVAINLEQTKARALMNNMLISKESDWASKYFASGIWATDIAGNASPSGAQALFWNNAASTPIEDIRAARTVMLESTGVMPNTMTVSQKVMDALVDHPDIVDRIKYSGGVGNQNPARTTVQALSQLFEIERILVSRGTVNTSPEGVAASNSFIAGNNALLTYSSGTPGIMEASAGYTFSWTGYLNGGNEFGVAMRNWRDEPIRADWVEAEMAYQHKLTAADLGYMFHGIVQ